MRKLMNNKNEKNFLKFNLFTNIKNKYKINLFFDIFFLNYISIQFNNTYYYHILSNTKYIFLF